MPEKTHGVTRECVYSNNQATLYTVEFEPRHKFGRSAAPSGQLHFSMFQYQYRELRHMKDAASELEMIDSDSNFLLETIVSAHYLALQMKTLARDSNFAGRDAAEFLAAALCEWASLAEGDKRAQRAFFDAPALSERH